jgi:hypothetical protein
LLLELGAAKADSLEKAGGGMLPVELKKPPLWWLLCISCVAVLFLYF